MRWAKREGRIERVKFAEARSASSVSGGRPCLREKSERLSEVLIGCEEGLEKGTTYLTRSARVNGWRGLAARRVMSPSVTVAVLIPCRSVELN